MNSTAGTSQVSAKQDCATRLYDFSQIVGKRFSDISRISSESCYLQPRVDFNRIWLKTSANVLSEKKMMDQTVQKNKKTPWKRNMASHFMNRETLHARREKSFLIPSPYISCCQTHSDEFGHTTRASAVNDHDPVPGLDLQDLQF